MVTNDLSALESWAGTLLNKLEPSQRLAVNRKIALELRRRQSRRIVSQRQPDGSGFIPRKSKKALRDKAGRIKRKSAKMFAKVHKAKFFKTTTTENQLAVGFFDRVARIARIHQKGLPAKISSNRPNYPYPVRVLLGFSPGERDLIRDTLLQHLQ